MTTPYPDPPPDLLRFARDVYARPGIQALCLQLQDEHDVDVVLLLTCCWHGRYHGVLTQEQFAQAMTFAGQWRAHLVQPLRRARRWLKSHPADNMNIPGDAQEALRERIKALELEAEFMQLRALSELFAATSAPAGPLPRDAEIAIRANLARYARECAGLADPDDDTLPLLIDACLQ